MINRKQIAAAAAASLMSPMTMAAVSDEQFKALQDQVAALTQALGSVQQELAAERARTPAPAPAATAAATVPAAPAAAPAPASWTEKITFTGDLRGRYENIDQEGSDERNRERFRARAALIAKPQSGLEVGFGLSTAQDADPVSSNQTIGNGGSRKDIFLDLAYFNWAATEGLNVLGGKFKNNIYRPGRNSLVWDDDLNPEGAGVSFVRGPFFANLLGTWIESDSNNDEAFGAGGQLGVALPIGESIKLTAGVGYFELNTEGKGAFFDDRFARNTTSDTTGVDRYVYDYDELEGFAELAFKLFGQPTSVFFDYVQNTDADEFDTGWAAGLQLGAVKGKGSWEARYAYQDLDADAVFGLWTDSDFGGGGTDTSGHLFRGAYGIGEKTNVAFSYYMNQFGEDTGTEETDYDRLQLDLNFKY